MINNKIKIAYILKTFGVGGIEEYIEAFLLNINKDRFDVILYCNYTPCILDLLKELKNKGVRVIPLFEKKQELLIEGETMVAIKRPKGIKFLYHLLIPDKIREILCDFINIFFFTPIFVNKLSKEKIDVIHFNSGGLPSLLPEAIAAWFLRIPCRVLTVHGLLLYNTKGLKGSIHWLLRSIVFLSVNNIIAVSSSAKEILFYHFPFVTKKTRVIYNGIDLEQVDKYCAILDCPKEKEILGLNNTSYTIGIIARLVNNKGHDDLIEAIKILTENNKSMDLSILIVGSGPEQERLIKETKDKGINRYFNFLGYRENAFKIIALCDLIVLPSLQEAFGYVLIEAMACSKPIIATKLDSIQEVVGDSAGILIPKQNPYVLAESILSLMSDAGKSRKMGIAGRQRVERLFQQKVMIQETANLYSRIAQT